MSLTNNFILFILFFFSGLGLVVAGLSKSWTAFLLALCLVVRLVVALALDGGLKYVFVIDSLTYEYKGWLLAQPWMSVDLFSRLTSGDVGNFNYYEIFLSGIYSVFGKSPILGMAANCLISTLTIWLLSMTYARFFASDGVDAVSERRLNARVLVLLGALYPSYLVWSTTTSRDPLYFFCCALFFLCFLTVFSQRQKTLPLLRALGVAGALLGLWLILGIRHYVYYLLLASALLPFLFRLLSRSFSWKTILLTGGAAVIGILYLLSFLFPDFAQATLKSLAFQREAFANLRLMDSVAKSSFGIGTSFTSVTDVLLFLPNALGHYFLGPFLWEVDSVPQVLALLEAFAVYLLIKPTWRGITRTYRRAPFETITILVFVGIFSFAQCLVISNMGTVFRHRTLPFLFLLIFTCEGLHEFAKKHLPPVLQA